MIYKTESSSTLTLPKPLSTKPVSRGSMAPLLLVSYQVERGDGLAERECMGRATSSGSMTPSKLTSPAQS